MVSVRFDRIDGTGKMSTQHLPRGSSRTWTTHRTGFAKGCVLDAVGKCLARVNLLLGHEANSR
jgi:hypothetical protein